MYKMTAESLPRPLAPLSRSCTDAQNDTENPLEAPADSDETLNRCSLDAFLDPSLMLLDSFRRSLPSSR